MKATPAVKLKKGQYLYFVNQDRLEEIRKSSNNDKDGMIRCYYPKLKKEREYSVKITIDGIKEGRIKLYDASQIKDGRIINPE